MKKSFLLLLAATSLLASCSNPTPPKPVANIDLITPANGEDVSILDEKVQEYIDAFQEANADEDPYTIPAEIVSPGVYVNEYYRDDYSTIAAKPVKLEFAPKEGVVDEDFTVYFADNEDFEDAIALSAPNHEVELHNLYCDTDYFWKVEAPSGAFSDVGYFHTLSPIRFIGATISKNVRDIGGKMTSSGRRVKQGLIYRGAELHKEEYAPDPNNKHQSLLDDEGIEILHDQLNIRYELDLRNAGSESNNQNASQLGEDVDFTRIPSGSYANIINVDRNKNDYANMFRYFNNSVEGDGAVYFHCWGGADRTGTIAFLLEGLLGCSYMDMCIDYELTSFEWSLRRRDVKVTDNHGYSYDFPNLISTIKKSTYWEEGKPIADFVKDWMIGALGMSEDEIETLKENLLEEE